MEYTILRHPEASGLIKEVNFLIGKGWEPLGGVAADGWYTQAMIKKMEAAPSPSEQGGENG